MVPILEDGSDSEPNEETFVISVGEAVFGMAACVVMGYFFYTKGYWVLLTQIWSSLFG